jgi:C4-type Zn-finger protein
MNEFKPKIVESREMSGRYTSISYKAHVQCIVCKRILKIKVNKNSIHLYTEAVLNNYKCYGCESKKKEIKNGTTGVSTSLSSESI